MVDTGLRGSLSDTVLDYEYDTYEYILRRIFIDFGMLFCNFIWNSTKCFSFFFFTKFYLFAIILILIYQVFEDIYLYG